MDLCHDIIKDYIINPLSIRGNRVQIVLNRVTSCEHPRGHIFGSRGCVSVEISKCCDFMIHLSRCGELVTQCSRFTHVGHYHS